MKPSGVDPKRALIVVCLTFLRLVLAIPVAAALPAFYFQYGEPHPSGGLNAIGTLFSVHYFGVFAGVGFLAVGSVAHVLLRYKRPMWVLLSDLALSLLFSAILAYVGASAVIVDVPPENKPASLGP